MSGKPSFQLTPKVGECILESDSKSDDDWVMPTQTPTKIQNYEDSEDNDEWQW